MSSDDAANRQDDLPLDAVPTPPADPSSGDSANEVDAGLWGDDFTEDLADPAAFNWFSAELENVNASDWDSEAASIWDIDTEQVADDGGGVIGLDFPL